MTPAQKKTRQHEFEYTNWLDCISLVKGREESAAGRSPQPPSTVLDQTLPA